MKVSTTQVFDRAIAQMSSQQGKVAEMQAKLATGKQLIKPSDNPEQNGLIQRLNSAVERQESYEKNLGTLNNRLVAEEVSLRSAENILQRIRELAVQAANGSLTAADREIVAVEVKTLREEFVSLANTKDVSGNYVFSGSKVKTPPFSENEEGVLTYQGDSNVISLSVSEQRQLAMNKPGNDVFTSVVRSTDAGPQKVGFFAVIDDFSAALEDNDVTNIHRGLAEVGHISEALSLSLADVGSRMTVAESQGDLLADTKARYDALLSDTQDLDYSTAVTKLSAELLSLEAAQSSFVKISQLSLFNYLR